MRRLAFFLLAGIAGLAFADTATPPAAPAIFAPGVIAGAAGDGTATFTPDGDTVIFMRHSSNGFTLMESRRRDGRWSTPQPAPFSGRWRDLDPAMAPDGSYLVFVSNRPATPDGQPLDAVHAGQRSAGHGLNLWRVDRHGDRWGTPVRLPDTINTSSTTFAPSVAADGSLYYIGCAVPDGDFKLLRAAYRDGRYAPPTVVAVGAPGAQIRDPAIAPDRSFIVFSLESAPRQPYRLAIAFRTPTGWSAPLDLGDTVNGGKYSLGAQLGPDHRTLYFYSDRRLPASAPGGDAPWNNGADHIWQVSLQPWLQGRVAAAH